MTTLSQHSREQSKSILRPYIDASEPCKKVKLNDEYWAQVYRCDGGQKVKVTSARVRPISDRDTQEAIIVEALHATRSSAQTAGAIAVVKRCIHIQKGQAGELPRSYMQSERIGNYVLRHPDDQLIRIIPPGIECPDVTGVGQLMSNMRSLVTAVFLPTTAEEREEFRIRAAAEMPLPTGANGLAYVALRGCGVEHIVNATAFY